MSRVSRASGWPVAWLLGIACLLAATTASAQTSLRWKFQKGQVLAQTITQDAKQTMMRGTTPVEITTVQTFNAVWTVVDVNAQGVAQVSLEMKRVQLSLAVQGVKAEFDSASDAEPAPVLATYAPALKALAKAKFQLQMTSTGEITNVQVSQETLDAFKSMAGGNPLAALLSKEGLTSLIKQGISAMPKDPVKAGATWTNSSSTDMPPLGKMVSEEKLKYVGPEELNGQKLERIDMVIATKLEPVAGAPAMFTMKEQNAKGMLHFDAAAGRISHSEFDQNLTLNVVNLNSEFKIQTKIKVDVKPVGP